MPDFVLEVASPSTAENDARYTTGEYAQIGVQKYWRPDPQGALLGTALEGYTVTGGSDERPGRGRQSLRCVAGLNDCPRWSEAKPR